MRQTLLAAVLCSIPGFALAQAMGETVKVGDWTIERVRAGGTMQVCNAARVSSPGNQVVVAQFANGFIGLVVDTPDLQVVPQGFYPLSYRIDRGPSLHARSQALTPHSVLAGIGRAEDAKPLLAGVRKAGTIQVDVNGASFAYKLTDGAAAMDRLAECVKQLPPP